MAERKNIHLRKDGRYEARYVKGRDEEGRLIYGFCYGMSYEEAEEKAEEALNKLKETAETLKRLKEAEDALKKLKGTENPNNCLTNSFGDFCDSWLATNRAALKMSSYAKYTTDMHNHLKPYFGTKLPGEITPQLVEDFTQMLLYDRKLSPKTVRDLLALFHSVFSYIERRSEQRLRAPEITYPKEHRKTVRVLSEAEEKALLNCLAEKMDLYKFGVYVALRTGIRIGEVCALRWCDIDFQTATISIRHTVQRIKCQDSGDNPKTKLVIGAPKSDSSYRAIPLMPDIETLCSHFEPGSPETFVLTGTKSCMDPRKLQRRLQSYLKECDIQEAHFHTLRHTFATRCVEVGFDVKTLSEILGHSNISITLNKYVHPNLNLKRENMSKLKSTICI